MDSAVAANILMAVIKVLIILGVLLTAVAYYTFSERKFSAFMQDRVGPNRAGPFGLLQPLADGVKFIMKEDVIPFHVDKVLYVMAPAMAMIPAMATIAVVPFAAPIPAPATGMFAGLGQIQFQLADVNVGMLYIFAVSGLAVYGVVMAGWASNNKYALLGSLRASAQMISYELTLGLSILGIFMIFETLQLDDIVAAQTTFISFLPVQIPKWGVVVQPLGFLLFLVATFAETSRLPFDLPEGEAEIVAGYHVEYGSMKFALFMMSEYAHMLIASMVITCLFFGGWNLPWVDMSSLPVLQRVAAQLAVFLAKTGFFAFLFIWVRWTLPRFRYDQLMRLGWKVLLPLAIANLIATGAFYVVKYTVGIG
jgi:NADH-quinone oxidoreductase subunit H